MAAMAKDQDIVRTSMRPRTPLRVPPSSAAMAAGEPRKARRGPIEFLLWLPQFLREVRVEARKITWTTWKETWITSVMVAIMVILTATFFFALDGVLSLGINALLKAANAE